MTESPQEYIDQRFPRYENSSQLGALHQQASKELSELEAESADLTWKFEAAIEELERAQSKIQDETRVLVSDVASLGGDFKETIVPKLQELQGPLQSAAVEKWRQLDIIKQQMARVQQVFEEAKQFNHERVAQEVEAKIETRQLDGAFELVDKYSALIYIWKGTSEYSKHHRFVTGLRKQVETAVQAEHEKKQRQGMSQQTPAGSPRLDSGSRPGTPSSPATKESRGYYKFFDQIQRNVF